MATLLWKGDEFRVRLLTFRSAWTRLKLLRLAQISHQEMIKGMRIGGMTTVMSYGDTLVIPIIANTPDEEDLREGMEEAMRKYPNAVSPFFPPTSRAGADERCSLLCWFVVMGRTVGEQVSAFVFTFRQREIDEVWQIGRRRKLKPSAWTISSRSLSRCGWLVSRLKDCRPVRVNAITVFSLLRYEIASSERMKNDANWLTKQ